MDNLSLPDFLVVRRHVIYVALCLLATTAGTLRADERAESAAPLQFAQQAGDSEPAATVTIQKIQRLLKLLASRYPERYRSVDPGRLDGVFGDETKQALRNFRAIAGLSKDPRPDTQLTADILSELALMSANEGATVPALGGVDCTRTPTAPACSTIRNSEPVLAVPAADERKGGGIQAIDTGSVKSETGIAAADTPPVRTASPETSRPKTTPIEIASATPPAESARPIGGRLYFVQAASLRSLESAHQEWARIKDANQAALHEEKVYFERADLKDRGIYYRILIGPQPDRDAANALCSVLKQNDRSCVVTSRSAADVRNQSGTEKAAGQADAADNDRKPTSVAPPPTARAAAPATPVQPPVAETTGATPPEGRAQGDVSMAVANPAPAMPAPASASPVETAVGQGSTSAIPAIPTPPVPAAAPQPEPAPAPQGEQHAAVLPPSPSPAPPAQVAQEPDRAAATPDGRPTESATGEQQAANLGLVERAAAAVRDFAARIRDVRVIGALAVLLLAAAVFIHRYRRIRRRGFSAGLAASGLPLAGISEGEPASGQTIATLEVDFDSEQLRDSRRIRDDFLRSVLDTNAESQPGAENGDSAIRINGSLKDLLATDPAQYKSIFLNLIFLSKLGAALNRKEITLDQLSQQMGRELELLQSYFKIHLLELDDRHRIRRELPGLFYCLQLSQQQMKPQSMRFSAA